MSKKICILDYGLGNIWSLKNSIEFIGFETFLYNESDKKEKFDLLIIPGVGSFSKASKLLSESKNAHLIDFTKKRKIPILGICLGMQILMTKGYEDGENNGLNLISGSVKKILSQKNEKLPNIGWKEVVFKNTEEISFLTQYSSEKFYFVHSYEVLTESKNKIVGISKYYNKEIISAVKSEKNTGRKPLQFCRLVRVAA